MHKLVGLKRKLAPFLDKQFNNYLFFCILGKFNYLWKSRQNVQRAILVQGNSKDIYRMH